MKLIITSPQQAPRELPLTASASIGRSADNTIPIEDPSVARYHAMIERRGNRFWLNDLGSTNGTMVNGARLAAEHPLQDGDTISLGSGTAIRVAAPAGQTAPAATAPVPTEPEVAPPTPAPAAPTEGGVPMSYVAVAGVTVVLLLAFVGIAVLVIKNRDTTEKGNKQFSGAASPATVTPVNGSKPTPTPEPVKSVAVPTGADTTITDLVSRLAGQLTGKGNYVFDPEMIAAINAQTANYRVDVSAPVAQYKLPVDRAFSNARALLPLYGHILALSRSRYGQSAGSGVSIWQLPPTLVRLQAGETAATLTPQRAADIAADHLKDLLTTFEPQDFMYAIACFGQSLEEAGILNQQLQGIDRNDRLDFWKQYKAGRVPRDGAEKVIRFFAAGIVGEYPKNFGLTTTAFSDL